MEEKISVIVPVYNVETYLQKCIESIRGQSYKNLEILLVNDGSTDRCGAICDFYAEIDSRISVIHKENGGLSDARNAGIEAATGDFIAFVDSDDWIDQDMYEVLHGLSMEHGADISLCKLREVRDYEVIDLSTGNLVICGGIESIGRMLTKENNYRFNHGVTNKLIRRELLKELRFPVGVLTEDLYFTPKLFYLSRKCVYLDEAKYNYLAERQGSIMNTSVHVKIIFDELNGLKEMKEFLHSKNISNFDAIINELYLNRVMHYYCRVKSSDVKNKDGILADLKADFSRTLEASRKGEMRAREQRKIGLFQLSPSYYYRLQSLLEAKRKMKRNLKAKSKAQSKVLSELT